MDSSSIGCRVGKNIGRFDILKGKHSLLPAGNRSLPPLGLDRHHLDKRGSMLEGYWIPASAGMTGEKVVRHSLDKRGKK